MVDANGNELPNIPGLGPAQPWINLLHTIGMPWVIIALSAWYGVPFAKDIAQKAEAVRVNQAETNKRMDALDSHAQKAMPMLEEATKAIPLLRSIHQATKEGAKQRHEDIEDLKDATVTKGNN